MDTIQVGIKALSKSSKSEPWKMTFLTPVDNVEMTMNLDKVEVGPRFREVLSTIESHQVYPRTITGTELENLGMTTRDSFIVKLLSNVPAHVEIGFRTFRQFRKPTAPAIKGEHKQYVYKPAEKEADVFSISATGGLPTTKDFSTTVKKTDYLLTGKLVLKDDGTIDDGDTFAFKITGAGVMAATHRRLHAGETIKVRVTGYNAPETADHGTSEGNTRNSEYIKAYLQHVEESKRLKTAFKIGAEAKVALQDFITGDGELVLEVDSNFDGSPKTDKYQRFVCAVYMTNFTSGEEVFESGEFTTTNVNKQMMGTMSKIEPKAPLTIPYYYFIDEEYSRLNTTDWLYELGIRKYADVKVGEQIEDYEDKIEPNAGNPLEGGEMVDIKYKPSGSNQIDYMEPYDDRRDKLFPEGVDHRVRIGDVMLTIPPIAIEVNRVGAIRKIKTLRSKSSMLIKGGSSSTILTLQLYFHDIDSINGRKEQMHPSLSRNYYMDGLRPLIAQFKKAPFVPIDNKYINETLGIDSVALVNLSIQTVPGFPHSIAANLVLAKFDHSAYMPQLSRLSMGINYPMFRWYYQEPMRDDVKDRSEFRTYLKPIPESGLTNDFKFQIAQQEYLEARKQALQGMRNMTNPLIAQERFFNPKTELVGSGGEGDDPNTLRGMEYKDGLAAQRVLDQYNNYLKLINSHKFEPQKGDRAVGLPNATKKEKQLFELIYGEGKTEDDVRSISHFSPYESHMYDMDSAEMGPGSFSNEDSITWKNEKNGGILIRLYAQKNIDLFKEKADAGKNGDLVSLYVPGYEIDVIEKIVNRGKAAETAYLNGIKEWNEAKAIIQQTEAKIPLVDIDMMGGKILPTAVSVMYENQFSNIQLQALDSPSFQFLGGQDPYVQVTFEADELGVQAIREMLETTETYARQFRTGITSGFLGVKNHLMQLFGIDTVMPETVQIRTVQGFPGRYQIDMTLCGFNKTQKRMEELEGLSPIYGDKVPDVSSREAGTVDEAADASIIEFRMRKMELYPDLELPTYDELINALPYMDAKCDVYDNRTGGTYVDPDFYMATPQTLRELVRSAIDDPNGHTLNLKDFMGVEMATSSLSTNPLDGEAGMWDVLNSVDSRTSRVSSNFSWSGNSGDKDGGDSNKKGVAYKNKSVEEYVKDRAKVKEAPAEALWKAWGLSTYYRDYNTWKEKTQPQEWEVYNKIYEMVDKLWVDQGLCYNDKNVDTKSKAWQKVTYASAEDLYDAEWNKLAAKDPNALKDGQKKEHKTSISSKDYKAGSKSKVPRERIANIIKAVIHARSKWQQMFSSGMPKIDGQGNAAGIMGIPLSSEAPDVETAKRLLWDWRYNIEFGVRQLFEAYKQALEEKGLEYKCRPWEWMVSAYATGTIKGDLRNGFWQQVNGLLQSHYNAYDKMYATPTSQMNMTVLQQKNGYSAHEMGVIQGVKGDLIQELLNVGYRRMKDDNLGTWNDEYYSKEETKKWLEGKSADSVRKIYQDYMEETFDDQDNNGNSAGKTLWDYWHNAGLDEVREEHVDEYETYKDFKETGEFIDNAVNNRLVSQDQPQDVFPEMFTDMIEYDHRMRLVRAFPTFQMFIVDEGKWMTNYRLWDNLYGFNAIQSIDIHKSRKIAADTAVITMTNVYSNLTSRSLDTTYEEWDYKFWDNLVFGNPNEKILEARNELLNSLMLQAGARIHLRLGYGSSATDLPVVFNGTITEMNADEIVEIVCQGDGIELGNVISGDPGDDNKSLLKGVTEPRDLICELLTSKGNWFKDVINYASEGAMFKDNPLGIQHFGQPAGKVTPPGNLSALKLWKNDNFGEAAQNVYSSNGVPTFSQWSMPDGSDIPWSFSDTPILKWAQPGDEQNVVVPFYNNTPWDIFQTLAYCSTDYICAVHPFEMRSTLFFGKPYWKMAYKYDSRYEYDKNQKAWIRYRDLEHRKPYAQFHLFSSETDIIGNGIKTSEEGVYTNVIVNYDGKQVGPIYADFDIRFDKQKTTVIDAQIVSRVNGLDFWTSEKQAMYYGMSAVRDYMKDMYKGELTVMGDPTIKPHDICYMNDTMYDMNGNFMVKAVTHHFSHETGFITNVQPDALVINDDIALLSVSNWGAALLTKMATAVAGYAYGARVVKKLIPSGIQEGAMKYGTAGAKRATEHALSQIVKNLPDDMPEVSRFKTSLAKLKSLPLDDPGRQILIEDLQEQSRKIQAKVKNMDFTTTDGVKIKGLKSKFMTKRTASIVRQSADALTDGAKAFKLVKGAGVLFFGLNPVTAIAAIATTWATETIAEKYRRKKAMMQCVLMMPLQYQGRQYTAGINGHRGMVVGDTMGRIDSFLSGMGFDGQDGNGEGVGGILMDAWNWLTDAEGKDYAISEEELRSNSLQSEETFGGWKDNE